VTTGPTSNVREAREALGARLRQLRETAGLSGRAVAAALGVHYTRVSKIEHGVLAPSEQHLRAWAVACGVEDQMPDLVASLHSLRSAYVEHHRQGRAGMKRVLGSHQVPLYERTKNFMVYETVVIPGLLQTAEYCASMLRFFVRFLETPNDIQAAVAVRMERQRVLYDSNRRKHSGVRLTSGWG
jgi:transcriptional regulator with XRE-family HTH domain